jgi:hypothetical protein
MAAVFAYLPAGHAAQLLEVSSGAAVPVAQGKQAPKPGTGA